MGGACMHTCQPRSSCAVAQAAGTAGKRGAIISADVPKLQSHTGISRLGGDCMVLTNSACVGSAASAQPHLKKCLGCQVAAACRWQAQLTPRPRRLGSASPLDGSEGPRATLEGRRTTCSRLG